MKTLTILALLIFASAASGHFKKHKKDKNDKNDKEEKPWEPENKPWDGGKDGCDVVYDDVWEEKCKTTYKDTKCWDEKDR